MGLLDEAIREHLELKRRRGGDPSAIAREEREALAPGVADMPEDEGGETPDDLRQEAETAPAPGAVPAAAHEHAEDRVADLSVGAQETAELDMQAVMGEDPDAADPGSPLAPAVDELTPSAGGDDTINEHSLEWELSGERDRDAVPQEIPGQERLTFE
jgi:phage repressor protein C with HTH and peptisase S24 domain